MLPGALTSAKASAGMTGHGPLMRLRLLEEEPHTGHCLLIRQPCAGPGDRAFYMAFAPRDQASLDALIRAAGQCWHIEQSFQTTKGECGLDQYEILHWSGWYRPLCSLWLTL